MHKYAFMCALLYTSVRTKWPFNTVPGVVSNMGRQRSTTPLPSPRNFPYRCTIGWGFALRRLCIAVR
jgi:hypothetical protein